jgi:hypothetical protein
VNSTREDPFFGLLFKPDSMFKLRDPGFYTLEVRIRLWARGTNGQYGVAVSAPVRVRVLKE